MEYAALPGITRTIIPNAGQRQYVPTMNQERSIVAVSTVPWSGNSNQVQFYSVPSGSLLRTYATHPLGYQSIAFCPGTSYFAISENDSLRVWNIVTGEHVTTLGGTFGDLSFSPDGTLLAGSLGTGTVVMWDAKTWKVLRGYPGGDGVVFTPDGSRIATTVHATTGYSFSIEIRDIGTGMLVGTYGSSYSNGDRICFSPDGTLMLSVNTGVTGVIVHRLADGTPLYQTPSQEEWRFVDVNPQGTYFVLGDLSGGAMVVDLHTLKTVARVPARPVGTVRYLPDGYTLLTNDSEGVKLWSLQFRWLVR
jgi:WD40 repeat protein